MCENWASQIQPRKGRPESSPGRQSWEQIPTMVSPGGTAETGGNGFSRPSRTSLLSQTQPRTDVLGYFQFAPSGLALQSYF